MSERPAGEPDRPGRRARARRGDAFRYRPVGGRHAWDPATCPADALPFLAWGLAISHWDTSWTVAEKRTAVAEAIPYHRFKGTRAAVKQVVAHFHPLLTVVEWWETSPKRDPLTLEVRANALEICADFLTQGTAEAIIRYVAAAKPLRDAIRQASNAIETQLGDFESDEVYYSFAIVDNPHWPIFEEYD